MHACNSILVVEVFIGTQAWCPLLACRMYLRTYHACMHASRCMSLINSALDCACMHASRCCVKCAACMNAQSSAPSLIDIRLSMHASMHVTHVTHACMHALTVIHACFQCPLWRVQGLGLRCAAGCKHNGSERQAHS